MLLKKVQSFSGLKWSIRYSRSSGVSLSNVCFTSSSSPLSTSSSSSSTSSSREGDQKFSSGTSVDVDQHKLTRPKPRSRQSLIPQTLREMEQDPEFERLTQDLKVKGQKELTREEKLRRKRALDNLGIPHFRKFVADLKVGKDVAKKRTVDTIQLNIGLYCNQACSHCHVESSPKRKMDVMSRRVANRCLQLLANSPSITTVDITGGAPELCPEFRYLVSGIVGQNKKVIDRCNLTVLLEPDQEDTPKFLSDHKVQVIASLPCYSAKNVNLQRGSGVFQRSIDGLKILNEHGYGSPDTGLELHLVYNPLGAFLPPDQAALESKYRDELLSNFGVRFNKLFVMTNLPVKRFADFLYRRDELESYMQLLVTNFNPKTLDGLMCKTSLSVDHLGGLYDCDFNQQLQLAVSGARKSIFDLDSFSELDDSAIVFDNHCYGCTAGQGSS